MHAVRTLAMWALGAAWLGAAAAGFLLLHRFDSKAGPAASPPERWPAASRLLRDPERPTLLVFAHPQCPCTAATIEEVNRLLTHCADRVLTVVLFFSDESQGSDWVRSSTWSAAAAIPGVTVVADPSGSEARRFDAQTSGETRLYTPDGELVFAGGITSARGLVGDNAGSAALRALVLGSDRRGAGPRNTPAYGCGLLDPLSASP